MGQNEPHADIAETRGHDSDSPTGGDLYDWFVLPDGNVHITLVDAVGHDVTSTRHALTVTHAIRPLALEGHPLHDLIARAARTLATIEPDLMVAQVEGKTVDVTGLLLENTDHAQPTCDRTQLVQLWKQRTPDLLKSPPQRL